MSNIEESNESSLDLNDKPTQSQTVKSIKSKKLITTKQANYTWE